MAAPQKTKGLDGVDMALECPIFSFTRPCPLCLGEILCQELESMGKALS